VPNKDIPNGAEVIHIPNYAMLGFGFPKGEQAPHKDILAAAEEMHIPDYVMLDFGFPEGMGISGKPPA
jgi:hypothetical protein